jgi:predicted SprT family Zn-dependent metalloprotease
MDDNKNIQQTVGEMTELICNHYGYRVPIVILNGRLSNVWGRCFRNENKIELSTGFCLANSDDIVFGLIKHEVAHFKFLGHGQDFTDECARMGISQHTRFDYPEAKETGKYTYMCTNCGKFFGFGCRPKNDYSCSDCSPNGRYCESCKLVDVTI